MQCVRSTILVTHIRRDNLLRSQACMKPRSVLAWPLKKGPHLMPSPSVFEQLLFPRKSHCRLWSKLIDHHCTKLITAIHFKLQGLPQQCWASLGYRPQVLTVIMVITVYYTLYNKTSWVQSNKCNFRGRFDSDTDHWVINATISQPILTTKLNWKIVTFSYLNLLWFFFFFPTINN